MNELSKPVAWTDERGNLCTNRNKERGLESRYHQDYEKYTTPFYSQEYVSALTQRIAELEEEFAFIMGQNDGMEKELRDKDARIEHLEAKLATPVRLTEERTLWAGEDDYDTGHVKGWNANRIEQAALLKKQGFTVEGDS